MKLPIAREDMLDEIAECLSNTNDLDVEWHQFSAAVIRVLESYGVTFEEPEPRCVSGEAQIVVGNEILGDNPGIFRDHRCWKCHSGAKPCAVGNPNQCEFPVARNH